MNLLGTLEANLALPRGPLACIGWADLAADRVPMPVSWADAEADTAWAAGILAGYGIGRGDHCLFVTAGRDYWPRQVETAVTALGGFIGNISPAGYEDRRLSVYLRFLPPTLIVGLSEELAEKAVRSDELVTLLKGVPHILAVPAAVRILAGQRDRRESGRRRRARARLALRRGRRRARRRLPVQRRPAARFAGPVRYHDRRPGVPADQRSGGHPRLGTDRLRLRPTGPRS